MPATVPANGPFASFACAQQPSRFQAKADIEEQATPAGSEASDPEPTIVL